MKSLIIHGAIEWKKLTDCSDKLFFFVFLRVLRGELSSFNAAEKPWRFS